MRVFLERLRDLILSCMEDFSKDHSSVSVSSCGMICFDAREGPRDAGVEANRIGPLRDGTGLHLAICLRRFRQAEANADAQDDLRMTVFLASPERAASPL